MQRSSSLLSFLSVVTACLLAIGPAEAQLRRPSLRGAERRVAKPPVKAVTGATEAPFRVLDNVEGPYVGLNTVSVRPMFLTSDGGHLYAVNTHGNTVVHFDNASGQPSQTFPVPMGPVSIAPWQSGALDELLVVCQVSHEFVRLDRLSGRVNSLLDLPFEPADLLVDSARGRAFVSCPGTDQVVEIDLASNTIFRTYAIPGEQPTDLAFDAQMRVLVAPRMSGNNSVALPLAPGLLMSSLFGIIDLESFPPTTVRLPDHDLFRIDPLANTVTALSSDAGTVLFGHGVNPVTGAHWQLATEAINKDVTLQSEPALRGIFAQNRIAITSLPSSGPPTTTHTVIDLDDTNPATPQTDYDPLKQAVAAQPVSLTFVIGGFALVVSPLSDNVTICDPQGQPFFRWKLAAGSIPRMVLPDLSGTLAFVYCWGTNRIEAWSVSTTPTLVVAFQLGLDPAPPLVKAGRREFYDADNSLHGTVSCATCHIDGGTDMIVWNLSDLPYDDKGPLVTQTLRGIEKLQPLHWRGERAGLIDFNPAFDKLLGGSALDTTPGGAFEAFEDFVFSLHNPANPHQDRRRVVSVAAGAPLPPGTPTPDAVAGQDAYFDGNQDGQSCNFCHTLPTGTDNETIFDSAGDPIPHRTYVKVTPYNEMWRKEQLMHPVQLVAGSFVFDDDYPSTGAGLTHAGLSDTLFDFVNEVFPISDQETADITSFVSQVDQGLAPAVHEAVHLASATFLANRPDVVDFLLPQAQQRNIDLGVFGRFTIQGQLRQLRWSWQRATGLFKSDDPALAPQTLAFLLGQARTGLGEMVFHGLPVGSGDARTIDRDDDGLLNLQEAALGCSAEDRDSDDDSFSDGYEVANGSNPADATSLPTDTTAPVVSNLRLGWITSKVARLYWDTNERTTHRLQYAKPGGPLHTLGSREPRLTNTALLTQMEPSSGPVGTNIYSGTLTVFDERGNASSVPLPAGLQTLDGLFAADAQGNPTAPFTTITGDLRWNSITRNVAAGTLTARADARIDRRFVVPGAQQAPNQVVIASVIKNDVRQTGFSSPLPTTFLINGVAPPFAGPNYVMSLPTGSNGATQLEFSIGGLVPGDRIVLVVEGVGDPGSSPYDPQNPQFQTTPTNLPFSLWSFPDTPPAMRTIELIY